MQTEQKFGAVTEFKFAVFVEGRNVDLVSRDRRRLIIRLDAVENVFHALGYVNQSCAAAVDDSRLFQHVELVGSAFERGVKFLDVIIEIFFKRGFVVYFGVCVSDSVAVDRKDRAVDGICNGSVRRGDALFKRLAEKVYIGFIGAFKSFGYSCKYF